MDIDHLTTLPARAQATLEVLERIAAALEAFAPALRTELDAKAAWRNDVNAKKAAKEAKTAEKARLLAEMKAVGANRQVSSMVAAAEQMIPRIKKALSAQPDISTIQLHGLVRARRATLGLALSQLLDRGEITVRNGDRNSRLWRLPAAEEAAPVVAAPAPAPEPPPLPVASAPKPVEPTTPAEKMLCYLEEKGTARAKELYAASGVDSGIAFDALAKLAGDGVIRMNLETSLYSIVK